MFWKLFKLTANITLIVVKIVNSRLFGTVLLLSSVINWLITRFNLTEDKVHYRNRSTTKTSKTLDKTIDPLIKGYNWIGLMKSLIKIVIYIQLLLGGSLVVIPFMETSLDYLGHYFDMFNTHYLQWTFSFNNFYAKFLSNISKWIQYYTDWILSKRPDVPEIPMETKVETDPITPQDNDKWDFYDYAFIGCCVLAVVGLGYIAYGIYYSDLFGGGGGPFGPGLGPGPDTAWPDRPEMPRPTNSPLPSRSPSPDITIGDPATQEWNGPGHTSPSSTASNTPKASTSQLPATSPDPMAAEFDYYFGDSSHTSSTHTTPSNVPSSSPTSPSTSSLPLPLLNTLCPMPQGLSP